MIKLVLVKPSGVIKMLKFTYTYSCLWRLTFNVQKSKVGKFGKGKTLTQQTWKLGKENIPSCDNYKHSE